MNGSVVYTPEELGADVDEDGNVVEAQVVEVVQEAEPEPEADTVTVTQTFTIEDACKTTTSQGKAYGEMNIAGLKAMLSAMHAKIAKNGLSPEDKAGVEHKIRMAQMVLSAKENGEIN